MKYIEVEQIRSPIRRRADQRSTLIGLKLNKIGRISWVPATDATRGMISKVRHLVQINYDPSGPKAESPAQAPDEAADVQLMRDLVFDAKAITLEPYAPADLKRGKTPDFKLIKDGNFVGYCEIKSPQDFNAHRNPPLGDMAIRRNVPFYRKLGSHIRGAVRQFDAENPDHDKPNVLVFVTHTPEIERKDVVATIVGLPIPGGGQAFLLGRKFQRQVWEAARKIDLIIWIDAKSGTYQHLTAADAKHRGTVLNLFDFPE